MKNPHIILLDGKLWAFEPPEHIDFNDPFFQTVSPDDLKCAKDSVTSAYSFALEQKIEIINPSEIGPFLLQENEPIKWDGTVEIVTQRLNKLDGSQGASRKVCRLIAPVKEELCPNCKETVQPCACMRNKCHLCGNPVGNITFTICDDCWDKKYPKPVPSEQEKQEPKDIDFLMWYSGNSQDEITSAYKRYLKGNQS